MMAKDISNIYDMASVKLPQQKYQLLMLALLLMATGTGWASALKQQIIDCSQLSNHQQRLACYDNIARAQVLTGETDKFQPPKSFLSSQLVAVAWKPEYTLTVRDFVALIHQAKMDNNKKIKIRGWERDDQHYVLKITMRSPVSLRFLPRNVTTGTAAMSLLREVKMDGTTINAEQFIMTIAAMVPDL